MTDTESARTAWAKLGASGNGRSAADWRVTESSVSVGSDPVLYAEDPNGRRHLLVPYPEGAPSVADRRSAGVHIVTRALEDTHGKHRFLDIACCKDELFGIFQHFVADVLDRLRRSDEEVAKTCSIALLRWRELLAPAEAGRLSLQSLAGLYAELHQLRDLNSRGPGALAKWRGPLGARHDFVADSEALEVKATTARDAWRVRIHGITQLEAGPGESLLLVAYRLEVDGMAGQSVPDLVNELISAGIDRANLISLLLSAGYSASADEYYDMHRFRVLDRKCLRVSSKTPRIVAASFSGGGPPPGVEAVEYTVDLAMADDALNPDQINEALNAFAGRTSHAIGPRV